MVSLALHKIVPRVVATWHLSLLALTHCNEQTQSECSHTLCSLCICPPPRPPAIKFQQPPLSCPSHASAGLYLGTFGPHGPELLQVARQMEGVQEYVVATKLTGGFWVWWRLIGWSAAWVQLLMEVWPAGGSRGILDLTNVARAAVSPESRLPLITHGLALAL